MHTADGGCVMPVVHCVLRLLIIWCINVEHHACCVQISASGQNLVLYIVAFCDVMDDAGARELCCRRYKCRGNPCRLCNV